MLNSEFNEIMVLYNKNMRDYNDNMHMYLEIIQEERRSSRASVSAAASASAATSTSYTTTEPTAEPTVENTFPTRRRIYPIHSTNSYNSLNTLTSFINLFNRRQPQLNFNDLEDVVVYPTDEQVNRATEIIRFNSENSYNNTVCPITLESFVHGEHVCKIKHCSHIFKQDAIINWFTRNVRCPVCRYDIRNYVENIPIIEEPENNELNAEEIDDDDNEVEDDGNGNVRDSNQLSDIFTTAVRELLQEQLLENQRNPTRDISNNTNNVRRSAFPTNFTSSIRNFITNEITQSPVVAELLYTFDIPIVLDMSNNRFRV